MEQSVRGREPQARRPVATGPSGTTNPRRAGAADGWKVTGAFFGMWGSLATPPALGAGDRMFESCHPDFTIA